MTLEENITAALESGRQKAEQILALRAVAQSRRADALQKNQKKLALRVQLAAPGGPQTSAEFQTAGFLAAAGDRGSIIPSTTFSSCSKIITDTTWNPPHTRATRSRRWLTPEGNWKTSRASWKRSKRGEQCRRLSWSPEAAMMWPETNLACC